MWTKVQTAKEKLGLKKKKENTHVCEDKAKVPLIIINNGFYKVAALSDRTDGHFFFQPAIEWEKQKTFTLLQREQKGLCYCAIWVWLMCVY